MAQPELGYRFQNQLGRLILCSMEEVIGKIELSSALNLAGLFFLMKDGSCAEERQVDPFEMLGMVQGALEQTYGLRGGQGLALRTGRVFFSQLIREYGSSIGLSDVNFSLYSPEQKIKAVIDHLAVFFNQQTDRSITITSTEDHIFWRFEGCPFCLERHESEPVCHLPVGILQEGLYWVSGGKIYDVVEVACIACGDPACIIRINRTPFA